MGGGLAEVVGQRGGTIVLIAVATDEDDLIADCCIAGWATDAQKREIARKLRELAEGVEPK